MRGSVWFVLVCVLAWLMPLGAFIKPSQEKTACGGHRAFHMCSMMDGDAGAPAKPEGWNAQDAHPGAKAPGSGGDDFLMQARFFERSEKGRFFVSRPGFAFSTVPSEIQDPPPKPAL